MITINDFPNIILQKLLPYGTKRRSGIVLDKIRFIVLHDTGNRNSSAKSNVQYYINSANDMSASAHIFVDDKDEVIECIPAFDKNKIEKAWHVLYEKPLDNSLYGDDANDIALGVELCYFSDIKKTKRAYINFIHTVAYLCYLYELNPLANLIGHYQLDPERKTDPMNALNTINVKYEDMLIHINNIYMRFINDNKEIQNDIVLFNKELMNGDLNENSVIKYGLDIHSIINIQNMLLKLGYKLNKYEAYGNYDVYTKNAVSHFQKDYKAYPIDGVCGIKTITKLIEEYSKI